MHTSSSHTFESILVPIPLELFASEYWAKSHLRVSRNNKSFYDGILSEDDLDFAVQAASRVRGGLELLNGPASRHLRNPASVTSAVKEGHSFRINSIQRFTTPISRLQASIEQYLSCHVNINMYLTPGAGRALGKHYDTHDVFVLQISGMKEWTLFDPSVPNPLEYLPLLRGEGRFDLRKGRLAKVTVDENELKMSEKFVLKAGDLLYLPRGFWHEAKGIENTVSCHLTVGLQTMTYLDLLVAELGNAAQVIDRLRQALPLGFASSVDSRSSVQSHLREILHLLPSAIDTTRALSTAASVFIASRQSLTEGRLLTPPSQLHKESVTLFTKLKIPEGLVIGVENTASGILLRWRQCALELPAAVEGAMRRLVHSRTLIPLELPADLSDSEKLDLARTLMEHGLLRPPSHDSSEGRGDVHDISGWLPISIDESRNIRWLKVGKTPLKEPFYHQSMRRFLREGRRIERKETAIDKLLNVTEGVRPSGFIFHISRCGSTLVSNALRTISGVRVISEAPILSQLLLLTRPANRSNDDAEFWEKRTRLLKGLMNTFGQVGIADDRALVVKFSSWNILYFKALRSLWPEVPSVIVIRNPLEVAVSCIEQPSGWMQWQGNSEKSALLLGLPREQASILSEEEYCARVLGRFLESANANRDEQTKIVDYRDLNSHTIAQIAEEFEISVSSTELEALSKSLQYYSKSSGKQDLYVDDSEAKRSRASSELSEAVSMWAHDEYERLSFADRLK